MSISEGTFERGRGSKQLIGTLILSASVIGSAFGIGMKIQKLVDELMIVTRQHQQILDMKPCRQDQ